MLAPTPEAAPQHSAVPAPAVSPVTLLAHAVDRAEGRLERARDDLETWRALPDQGDAPEVTEIRLLSSVVAAERELAAVRTPAPPMV